MANGWNVTQIQDELILAVKQGDEVRARTLVAQLGSGPRRVRAVLEAMLEDPRGLVRQAAAFGLGVLGGAASVTRLEQQLALEEARRDYDGQAVMEDITRALARIQGASARAALIRKLERLMAGKPERSEVNELAEALWMQRHPDLLWAVRRSLERAAVPRPNALNGLEVLLEKSPQELGTWAADPTVPPEHKTEVLMLLVEELPEELVSILPAFISTAHARRELAASQRGEAASYCGCLFSLLLLHRERILPSLSEETRSLLRFVARECVGAPSPNCSIRAVKLLKFVGRPEDVEVILAHRPADSVGARVFDEAARVLHEMWEN
jgi:hypothetical protein